jgi:DNA-binding transcriptional LysR family regulator
MLHRTKRRVELTEAGRRFLDEAREILARVDRAAVVARRARNGEPRHLRVGIGYCMDAPRVAAVVGEFNARHEAVRIDIHTMAVPLQFAALRAERLDVGFVRPPVTDPTLNSEVVASESLVVALPAHHRLAAKDGIPLATLANEPSSAWSRRAGASRSCPLKEFVAIARRVFAPARRGGGGRATARPSR